MANGGSNGKGFFTQEVDPLPAFVGVGLAIVWIILGGVGRAGLGFLVVIGGLAAMVLVRRLAPPKTVRFEESVELPHDRERVWDLICPAENAPLLDETIRHGYRVPGYPEGLGERQAFESVDGFVIIVEVVELAPGHCAVVRQVSPPDVPVRVKHEVVDVLGRPGCVYRQTIEVDLARGRRLRPGFEKTWRTSTRSSFGRIASELESGPWPPPPPVS